MDVNIGTKPVDGYQLQVTSEIPCVLRVAFSQPSGTPTLLENASPHQSREWKAISKTGHGSPEIARLEILIKVLSLHGRIHVGPNERYRSPRNSSSLVGNLDGDVLLAFDNDDLDGREVIVTVGTVSFDHGSQRVFEQFEADVG